MILWSQVTVLINLASCFRLHAFFLTIISCVDDSCKRESELFVHTQFFSSSFQTVYVYLWTLKHSRGEAIQVRFPQKLSTEILHYIKQLLIELPNKHTY